MSFLVAGLLGALGIGAPAALSGCVGTSVGNPPGAEVKLAVVGTGSIDPPPSEKVQSIDVGGGILVEEAWVSLTEIGLHAAGMCGVSDGSPDVPGTIAAELVTGSIYPEAPLWERPAGESYCAFRTRLSPLSAPIDNTPEALAGHAVLIRGTRGDGTPFEARIDLTDVILITGSKGPDFRLGTGLVGLILAFDLGSWFSPGMLDAAQVTDGSIAINAASNKEIEKSLRLRIPASSQLFTDANGDGRLNPGDGEL
jgi:hypothetical protein